jgi:hypothetical protein
LRFGQLTTPTSAHRVAADRQSAALNRMENLTPGLPLGLPASATTVRVRDGATVRSDGPFLGAHGAIGGTSVLETDDLDAAIAVAEKIPAARLGGAIEIRPVDTDW